MKELNDITLNLFALGLGSLRGLSLGDLALLIAWTLVVILYFAAQASRFPRKRRPKSQHSF